MKPFRTSSRNSADTLNNATISVTTVGGTAGVGLKTDPAATVRNSSGSVGGAGSPQTRILDAGPTGGGEITDMSVTSGGLGVQFGMGSGAGIVMRRLRINAQTMGVYELTAPLTLTDSLVTSGGAALRAENGTITARNDTVVASTGAGLHAIVAAQNFLSPGAIDARNVIARGASVDVLADPRDSTSFLCTAAPNCAAGVVHIAYSNLRTSSGAPPRRSTPVPTIRQMARPTSTASHEPSAPRPISVPTNTTRRPGDATHRDAAIPRHDAADHRRSEPHASEIRRGAGSHRARLPSQPRRQTRAARHRFHLRRQ
jgi:hypothetical protein